MLRNKSRLLSTSLAFALSWNLGLPQLGLAQDANAKPADVVQTIAAGHSYHGEAFNEGPRQEAYLMGNIGECNFPVTTSNPEAQKFFNQGIAQIHGFWYLEAERSFRQVLLLDENCAMAYWGMAYANRNNVERSKKFIVEADKRKEKLTPREKKYIEGWHQFLHAETKDNDARRRRANDLLRTFEDILLDNPDDLEAKALLCGEIWHMDREGLSISSYHATSAMLNEVFAKQPLHPAHHYRIHLWDHRKAELAVEAAMKCGQSAPGIAHMWHMPGHIFSNLKRYEEACYQQEASARVDHAHMMRDRIMPDQIHNFSHNNEWLIRNLIFVGRASDALSLAKNMYELPRHPKYNSVQSRGSTRYGRDRMLEAIWHFRLWKQAHELAGTPYFESFNTEEDFVDRAIIVASAAIMEGDVAKWSEFKSGLSETLTKVEIEQALKGREAGDKSRAEEMAKTYTQEEKDKAIAKAIEDARRGYNGRIEKLKKAISTLDGMAAFAAKEYPKAYECLKDAGTRDSAFVAELRYLAGEKKEAIEDVKKQLDRRKNETIPLAVLTYLYELDQNAAESQKTFEELRKTSSSIDLSCEIFRRLDSVANRLGYTGDWRIPAVVQTGTAERPQLDTLGPFCWQPTEAPKWSVVDQNGVIVTEAAYRGRPTVVLFYLGSGCLHCAEQLKAFADHYADFQKAGFEVIAISSDSIDGLKTSIDNYGQAMPIKLLSDAELTAFKSFRAFDDFEKQPLHGTYIIDGQGKIRWQDISFEPFMDYNFVIAEAKRLTSQSSGLDPAAVTNKEAVPAEGVNGDPVSAATGN